MRHQEHKIFHLYLIRLLPSRTEGLRQPADGYPVIAGTSIGVLAWVLLHANVIDMLGLVDYVIARNPDLAPGEIMVQQRQPAFGYVACFEPNAYPSSEGWEVRPRTVELTADAIRACERRFAR